MMANTSAEVNGDRPSVSVVICVDDVALLLRSTLSSLENLGYSNFEVCLIFGPNALESGDILRSYQGRIKVAHNSTQNVASSRNIGIGLATGKLVAFLQSDSVPEPEWLRDFSTAFREDRVAAVGGILYGHTGTRSPAPFGVTDRLGRRYDYPHLISGLSFPLSAEILCPSESNCAYRRDALLAVGGFDEEYDRFLEVADLAVRLADADWDVRLIEGAYAHELPSATDVNAGDRMERRFQHWRSLAKNKLYFALRHGLAQFGADVTLQELSLFVADHVREFGQEYGIGSLTASEYAWFQREIERDWREEIAHGHKYEPHLLTDDTLRRWASPFLPFQPKAPDGGRRTYCLVSQEYEIGKMGGIGRYTHELAAATAALGHQVHVITRSSDVDRVTYEQGVWVHRITDRRAESPQPGGLEMPWYRWGRAVTVLETIDEINARRRVDTVSAPIWDCEGIAVAGRYPLATILLTSMIPWLASNPSRRRDRRFMRTHVMPMIAAEQYLLRRSEHIITSTRAILEETLVAYDVTVDSKNVSLIPFGLSDWATIPCEAPPALSPNILRIAFIGRLEERKGIDVLLGCAPLLLSRYPHVHLDLVGDDSIRGENGRTWREGFETSSQFRALRARVQFHGAVSDARLQGFYKAADIVVAPSRYESFGLVLVEAMMFGKAVVGCRAGGMAEVVEDGVSGVLAEPGNEASLAACLERLIVDAALRERLGQAARARYEERFTIERMCAGYVEALEATALHGQQTVLDVKSTVFRTTGHSPAPASEATHAEKREVASNRVTTTRVLIVAPMLARHDGVSTAACETYRMLCDVPGWETQVITLRNDRAEIPAHIVSGVGDLLIHEAFLQADLLIYHFAIHNELFDVLLIGNGHARQIVYFHNVTPLAHVPEHSRPVFEASFQQITNLACADEVWAVSEVNRDTLLDHGIERARIQVIPSTVNTPRILPLGKKKLSPFELLFVGRIVPSKGVLDLIHAVALLRSKVVAPLRLSIVGNLEWSDRDYVARVRQQIHDDGVADIVCLRGSVDDRERDGLYHRAHILVIPSYHEGFCVPVVEGLRSGCIPVGYAASNLPYITNGLGRLVPCGDWQMLAAAIAKLLSCIDRAMKEPDAPLLQVDRGCLTLREYEAVCRAHVDTFTFERLSILTRDRVRSVLAADNEEAE